MIAKANDWALRQRLLLRLMTVLAATLVLIAVLAYWRSTSKVRTELHSALTVGEQVLLDAVKEVQRSPAPYQQLRIVIERFSGGRHLKVALLDADGRRVAASRLENPDEPAPAWFYRLIGGDAEAVRIGVPGNIKGYSQLLLEADPRNEVQEVWEELNFALLIVTVVAVLAGGLIYYSIGRELSPLDELNGALARVASGDFHVRVSESGSADLRAVSKGFNEMVAALELGRTTMIRLEEQLATVQEEERTELARDLHDEIGPLLFSVSIDAAEAKAMLGETGRPEIQHKLDIIRDSVRRSQKHVLRLLGRLRNGTVDDLGLEGAVAQLLDFWRSRQPQIEIKARVPDHGLGGRYDAVVYRIIQESISNAIRHGKPRQIVADVTRMPDDALVVRVCDDAGGLRSPRIGNGLTGMRERVELLNGTLEVRTRPDGEGTVVVANLPPEPLGHAREAEAQTARSLA